MNIFKKFLRLYYSPDTHAKSINELLYDTDKLISAFKTKDHDIIAKKYRMALEYYEKGMYEESINLISDAYDYTLGKDIELTYRLAAIGGMITLRAGIPDALVEVTQSIEQEVEKGKIREPKWLVNILYVSACAAMLYGQSNREELAYKVALRWLRKLHEYNMKRNIFDKAIYVISIECNYLIRNNEAVRTLKEFLFENITNNEIKEIKEYFMSRDILL